LARYQHGFIAIFNRFIQPKIFFFRGPSQGRRHGVTGGTVSPTPYKDHFYKSSKTDEKILGVWGGDVTNHT